MINGQFSSSENPSLNMFPFIMQGHLEDGKVMEVDNGYMGDLPVYTKVGRTRAKPSDILFCQKDFSVLLPLPV